MRNNNQNSREITKILKQIALDKTARTRAEQRVQDLNVQLGNSNRELAGCLNKEYAGKVFLIKERLYFCNSVEPVSSSYNPQTAAFKFVEYHKKGSVSSSDQLTQTYSPQEAGELREIKL